MRGAQIDKRSTVSHLQCGGSHTRGRGGSFPCDARLDAVGGKSVVVHVPAADFRALNFEARLRGSRNPPRSPRCESHSTLPHTAIWTIRLKTTQLSSRYVRMVVVWPQVRFGGNKAADMPIWVLTGPQSCGHGSRNSTKARFEGNRTPDRHTAPPTPTKPPNREYHNTKARAGGGRGRRQADATSPSRPAFKGHTPL